MEGFSFIIEHFLSHLFRRDDFFSMIKRSIFCNKLIYCLTQGGVVMELQDVLRVAGVGLIIALLHVFFEQIGKKEFSFFIFLSHICILRQN